MRRSSKEYHEVRPATEKAQRSNLFSRKRGGTVRWCSLAERSCSRPERSCSRLATSETGVHSRPDTVELSPARSDEQYSIQLVVDTLWNVEPVQIAVQQRW